jgi:hypothetical protein|tara:strand:- start:333 stop:1121 length:789 start_codon:yes stop_codon:yes gene_type:complete
MQKQSRLKVDLSVNEGKPKPPILTIYGGPGIGKTTFGATAPDPVFLMAEDGCPYKIPKIPKEGVIESWVDALAAIRWLIKEEHDRKTLIVDTVNKIVQHSRQHVCDEQYQGRWKTTRGQEGFNAFGYGEHTAEMEFQKFLKGLSHLKNKKGMWIILLAHEGQHRQGNLHGEDFKKLGGLMHHLPWSRIVEWSDQVAHVTKDFVAIKKDGDRVAKIKSTSERKMYFEGDPSRDAKCRDGIYKMPSVIKFSYANYMEHSNKGDK